MAEESGIELQFAANKMNDELNGYYTVLKEKISSDPDCIEKLASNFDVQGLIDNIKEKENMREAL